MFGPETFPNLADETGCVIGAIFCCGRRDGDDW